jgi:PadR family transcriptional regulator PadR
MTRRDLLPGLLDMLILRTLSSQSMHGYGIAQHLQRLSQDVIQVEEGSLYPALQRMRQKGWVRAEWPQADGFTELMAAVRRVMQLG